MQPQIHLEDEYGILFGLYFERTLKAVALRIDLLSSWADTGKSVGGPWSWSRWQIIVVRPGWEQQGGQKRSQSGNVLKEEFSKRSDKLHVGGHKWPPGLWPVQQVLFGGDTAWEGSEGSAFSTFWRRALWKCWQANFFMGECTFLFGVSSWIVLYLLSWNFIHSFWHHENYVGQFLICPQAKRLHLLHPFLRQ